MRHNEAGVTLGELIITVVILGLAVAGIVGALGTALTASAINRQQTDAEAVIRSYAESVQRATYVTCATSYPPSGVVVPVGIAASTTVAYAAPSTAPVFGPSCPGGTALQRVTITATSTDGRTVRAMSIVKRSPS